MRRAWRTIVGLLTLGLSAGSAHAQKLPALGADAARVSVSGLSSGGYMAIQYAVAYSATTMGVGVIAAGPYNCALVTPGGITGCTAGAPNGEASWSAAQGLAALGQVDAMSNLRRQRVYLFRGTKDPIVSVAAMDAARDFFELAGVPKAQIRYVNTLPAGHAFITPAATAACGSSIPPFLDLCQVSGAPYDQPGDVLGQIYGPLKPRATALSAAPKSFDQAEFAKGFAGLAKTGFIYTPAACAAGAAHCAVHVVFHGCGQSARFAKDAVYARVGYNAWAESNGIIVLYPQVDPTVFPLNPEGCWDWWGATGLNFQSRTGAQPAAIRAMVQRLTTAR